MEYDIMSHQCYQYILFQGLLNVSNTALLARNLKALDKGLSIEINEETQLVIDDGALLQSIPWAKHATTNEILEYYKKSNNYTKT